MCLASFGTAWSNTLSGSGTDTDPYKIASLADWKTFVDMCNHDENLDAGKYFEMTKDITIEGEYTSVYDTNQMVAYTELIGGFSGTFNGGGHTLTFSYTKTAGQNGIAPFSQIANATIRNLKVAGTITTNKNYAGGIAYYSLGSNTIENCTVSITINSSINRQGWHGGFVGWNTGTLTFKNCVFNGSLLGSNTYACGGFIWYDTDGASASFTDCLFAPAQVTVTRSSTFSYNRNGDTSTFTRAYYTQKMSNESSRIQGTHIYATAPTDRLTKKITAADNNQYWAEGSANITGLFTAYALSEANSMTYSVEFDGTPLTSGTDYTASITKDGQAVETISETGTYTLTITGTGNYAGSFSRTFEAYSQESVPYIDANGQLQHQTAEQYSATNTPQGDWWYVTGEATIDGRIDISGTKNLILCDGATFTLPKGIRLENGNTLNIYGQSAGTGKLIISIADSGYSNDWNAGIGGNNNESCGTLVVNGGEIEVTGGKYSAGIGGGTYGSGGNITINGGKVTASTKKDKPHGAPAAIGGGGNANGTGGAGGTITINGGIVSATGTSNSVWHCSGMGGGYNNNSGTVSLKWKNPTDRIYANSYNSNVTLSGQFMLEGTDTPATTDNISGKTLVPALTVKFDSDGGTGTMSDVLKGASMDYELPDCGFTAPTDKEFDCWEIDGTQYNAGGAITMNGNITVKAVWRNVNRTVTFDANGHGTAPDSQTVEHGGTASEPEAPQEEGYTFGGWYKEAGCTNMWDFESDTVTADVTLYATWTAHTYTVKFDANNGAGEMDSQGYTYDTESALTANAFTREGYNFAGWNTKSDGSGNSCNDGQTVKNLATGGEVTLYAQWTAITYSITYELDGGTVTGNPTSYTIESDAITLTNPTKAGYTFMGWTGTDLDEATLTATIPAGSTGIRSYTATWRENFAPKDPNTPEFAYHSLILSGQIGVIFHVYVPDGSSSKDYCMYFDVSGDKSQNTQPVYPFEILNEDGHKFFGFKCYINSVQMADDIHAVLNYGDNESITETYTAKRYLDALISKSSQPADVIGLGKAIKDYGCYVQPILAAENHWEIGKKHASMDCVNAYTNSDFTATQEATASYAINCSIPDGSGIKDVSFALILDSETAIELYLTSKDGYTGNVEAYVDTNTTDNVAVNKGNEYVVNIGGISAHKLGHKYIVNVVTGSVRFNIEVYALSYVQAAINSNDSAMKCAVTSLYRY